MKDIKEYINESLSKIIVESNQFINKEITPDNFDEKNFTPEEAKIIKNLLKDYKKNLCWMYLVDGSIIPKSDSNIKHYFGDIVPKDKKGILYIERESTQMGAQEYAKLYETK